MTVNSKSGPAISVPVLKSVYLHGWSDKDPNTNLPYPTQSYEYWIDYGYRLLETLLDISILPVNIVDEQKDYYAGDYQAWGWLQLHHYPVQEVTSLIGQFPTAPTQLVFPPDWFVLDKGAGHLQLVPSGGNIAQFMIGSTTLFLPLLQYGRYLPGFWKVSYTAGFPENEIPKEINHAAGMLATCGIADVLGDLIGGFGVLGASVGLDGASQFISLSKSATTNALYSRILSYRTQLFGSNGVSGPGTLIHTLKRRYHGIGMINL